MNESGANVNSLTLQVGHPLRDHSDVLLMGGYMTASACIAAGRLGISGAGH